MKTNLFTTLLIALLWSATAQSAVYYVDQDATGADNGSSWNNAFEDLQDALATANSGDELWVAEGIYFPTSGTNRDIAFDVPSGVQLYGGFNGTEGSRDQRDWAANETFLSGNIGVLNSVTDNSKQLLNLLPGGDETVCDGFLLVLTYNETNTFDGGAIFADNTTFVLRHLIIRDNIGYRGAAVNVSSSTDTDHIMRDCLVHDNSNTQSSLVRMSGSGLKMEVTNCTFTQNDSPNSFTSILGGIIDNLYNVTNTIIYDNAIDAYGSTDFNVQNCLIEEGFPQGINSFGANIITSDPLFTNPAANDFTLQSTSPAVDFGENEIPENDLDLAHNSRLVGSEIDLGAYEFSDEPLRHYVDADASGSNNGSTWANAFTDLQDAFAAATAGDAIWVAEGVYKPTSGSNRAITFEWPANVEVLGGFAGNEVFAIQRNPWVNLTILSGDIGVLGDNSDNSRNVIRTSDPSGNYEIKGFVIEDGKADGNTVQDDAPAIRAQDGESLTIADCWIKNNTADGFGAVWILNYTGEVKILRTLFEDNDAPIGAAIVSNKSMTVANSFFLGNVGNEVIRKNAVVADQEIINCNFALNEVSRLVIGAGSPVEMVNSIVWDNTIANDALGTLEVSHSIYQNLDPAFDLGNNLDADPQWQNPAERNYNLSACSPAINAGSSDGDEFLFDFVRNNRTVGAIDIGAYEFQGSGTAIVYVDQDASGANDGSSWTNAFSDLNDAFSNASPCSEIWVAEGVYKPTTTTNRFESFNIFASNLSVYGGFEGTETSREERDWASNETAISGAIGSQTDITDNSHRLLRVDTDADSHTLIDGIKFRRAYSELTTGTTRNTVTLNGGDISFNNCVFNKNTQELGAVINDAASGDQDITFSNCLIYDNTMLNQGRIFNSQGGVINIINCTVADNLSENGQGIVFAGNTFGVYQLQNSISFGNDALQFGSTPVQADHCLLQNPNTDPIDQITNSVSGLPFFVDAANEDYRLNTAISPAFNAGDNSFAVGGFDLDANPRVSFGTIDLGCYESEDAILFVDQDAASEGDGKSWATAFNDLQDALAVGQVNQQIWVAEGSYKPTSGSNRFATFNIPSGVRIYGGFDGTETSLDQRDWVANYTEISGDVGTSATVDNSTQLLTFVNKTEKIYISGFTISDTFSDDQPVLNNRAASFIDGSQVAFEYCIFTRNASYSAPACLITNDGIAEFNTCLFHNNTTEQGGIISANGVLEMNNCTMTDNELQASFASDIGGNTQSGVTYLYNSIFWEPGRQELSGVATGGGSELVACLASNAGDINSDPLFTNVVMNDYSLMQNSPANDAGNDAYVLTAFDLSGAQRIQNASVDMGAYETELPPQGCTGDLDGDGTIATGDIILLLGQFGCEEACSADLDGNGSVGTGDLIILLGQLGSDCE